MSQRCLRYRVTWALQQVVPEDVGPDGSIKYYRDAQAVHHVPKRALAEPLVN